MNANPYFDRTETAAAEVVLRAVDEVLAEGERIKSLSTQLEADRVAAQKNLADAERAKGEAEAEVLLAPDAEVGAWRVQAEAAETAAFVARRQIARLDGAAAALPSHLAKWGQGLAPKLSELHAVMLPMRVRASDALQQELAHSIQALAATLQKAAALQSVGFVNGGWIADVAVPNPSGPGALISGGFWRTPGGAIRLDRAWTSDPASHALAEALRPFHSAVQRLTGEAQAITRAAEAARLATPAPKTQTFEPVDEYVARQEAERR